MTRAIASREPESRVAWETRTERMIRADAPVVEDLTVHVGQAENGICDAVPGTIPGRDVFKRVAAEVGEGGLVTRTSVPVDRPREMRSDETHATANRLTDCGRGFIGKGDGVGNHDNLEAIEDAILDLLFRNDVELRVAFEKQTIESLEGIIESVGKKTVGLRRMKQRRIGLAIRPSKGGLHVTDVAEGLGQILLTG